MTAPMQLTADALREVAMQQGVCIRPIVHELVDTVTGQRRLVPIPCGSTWEAKCPPCAEKNRRLRMQQCREGWHLEEEPIDPSDPADDEDAPTEHEDEPEDEHEEQSERRVRSTRRRQDVPDLPRLPVEDRTLGRTFTAPDGKVWRPSMFATFTLPSYGRVRPDGTPVDPESYDYRRAALDALHFPKLVDRLWQNLRRAVGFKVQYFAAVEAQRRLAPHLHAAIRGAIPRQTFRQVVAATYHQVWWPAHNEPVYTDDQLPVWRDGVGYVDPVAGTVLPTWDEALDALDADEDARPAHVVRFGRQLDLQGIIAGTADADRRIGYLAKYLTKSMADTYGDPDEVSAARAAHLDRLHEEVRWLPCSPRCANWLRFGIQPKGRGPGMVPGQCGAKAHDRAHVGCGGRRVLVSRRWSGKTLAEHRADRATVVREVLKAAGIEVDEVDRCSATVLRRDGKPRYRWSVWDPIDATVPVYRQVMTAAIGERVRWRTQYEQAKRRAGPDLSATASKSRGDAA